MTDDVQRDLGRHEERLSGHDEILKEIRDTLKSMDARIGKVESGFSEISGGKKAIALLVAAAASAGGFVHWLIATIQHKPDGVP